MPIHKLRELRQPNLVAIMKSTLSNRKHFHLFWIRLILIFVIICNWRCCGQSFTLIPTQFQYKCRTYSHTNKHRLTCHLPCTAADINLNTGLLRPNTYTHTHTPKQTWLHSQHKNVSDTSNQQKAYFETWTPLRLHTPCFRFFSSLFFAFITHINNKNYTW